MMLRKIYLTVILAFLSVFAFAQTGTLKGVINNEMTGEPIPFANVVIEKNGVQSGGASSDFDGNYTIKPIEPGNYTVKATCVGFGTVEITGVIISANKITFQDIKLQEGIAIGEVKIIAFTKPLLDQDNLSGETKTAEEIVALPTRSVASVAATTAGIYQRDEGDGVNIRGSRGDATEYYIDGIKVRGALGVPTSGIEQITVITGGLPAQYGDATGGVISVTTKGPSSKLFGGLEFESSSLFDKYNYNLLGFALSGPIIKKRNKDGTKGNSILGYFISGEIRSVDDTDPSAIGRWKVKDAVLEDLKQNPFMIAPNASAGFLSRSEFLREKDFENVQARLNAHEDRRNISVKLDFKPANNTFLSLGGSYYYRKSRDFSSWRSMFSWEDNRESSQNTYRLFGKLTQKFGSESSNEESSSSTIKNAFFTMQADYTNNRYTFLDAKHQDNLFHYGYVGRFNTYKAPIYQNDIVADSSSGITYEAEVLSGFADTLYTYTPGGINPGLENYTNAYYQMFSDYGMTSYMAGFAGDANDGVIRTAADLMGQGLMNGDLPSSVYSLYGNHGYMYNGYAKQENTQTTFKASGSADVKSHEISFGFEYEEREDYYYGTAPMNLWNLMRQQANKHILELDLNNPIAVYENGIFQDTIEYNRLNADLDPFTGLPTGEFQSHFDRSLRESLGLDADGVEFIDIDSYDPSTFSLDLFSQDELLNNGSSVVYYYGYDIYGNKIKENNTLDDFFTHTNGNLNTRNIAPYNPIYQAGYIQDKFAIDDLIFNIGLRIDRFDANQKVLSDKYLLYSAYTAGSDFGLSASGGSHPSTIGDDYVVYVDDFAAVNPNTVGYRNGDVWYNAEGIEISDPLLLAEAAGGKIQPYIIEADEVGQVKVDEVFEDYKPETVFMPRVAFSFPISDEAQFFAHYDVLTQRPPSFNRLEPVDYLFMADRVGARLNNPDLKPEKTVDYELGFAKTLSLKSALKISAFYKELRDMIQVTNILGAYPAQYYTFGNIDFGTVKGMSINYDLRRTNNVQLTANYTLQFADGTGSSSTTAQQLVNDGFPNLRTTLPLDFDQRHNITANIDYRYGSGSKYNGPVLFGKNILEGFGANLVLSAGSGRPYSQQSNILAVAQFGVNTRSTLEGSVNGAREPWTFRTDLRINKEVNFKLSEDRKLGMNVYMMIENLLNADNIVNVYRYTGNADDDGYLSSAEGEQYVSQQVNPMAFSDQYTLKVNNPDNYVRPRLIKLGMQVNF